MRRHCQFTVKRFEVNYSNMGLELAPSCLQGKRIAMFALVSVNPVGFGWRGFSLIVLGRPSNRINRVYNFVYKKFRMGTHIP